MFDLRMLTGNEMDLWDMFLRKYAIFVYTGDGQRYRTFRCLSRFWAYAMVNRWLVGHVMRQGVQLMYQNIG